MGQKHCMAQNAMRRLQCQGLFQYILINHFYTQYDATIQSSLIHKTYNILPRKPETCVCQIYEMHLLNQVGWYKLLSGNGNCVTYMTRLEFLFDHGGNHSCKTEALSCSEHKWSRVSEKSEKIENIWRYSKVKVCIELPLKGNPSVYPTEQRTETQQQRRITQG